MAYDTFEEPAEDPGAGMLGGLMTWTGALLSIALVVGLSVWGYRLVVRDVSGVPVVRALEGPMRVPPEDPGGRAAANQGLAVNEVQAEGEAEAPAHEVTLAPAPVELADDDAPARRPPATTAPQEVSEIGLLAEAANGPAAAGQKPVAVSLELVDSARGDGIAEGAVAAAEIIPASVPGPARAPRPVPRPAEDLVALAAAAAVAKAVRQEPAAGSTP